MQGYIVDIKAVKDDDLIVTIICENELITSYRFYGARHSNINIGYKIDFELETTKSTIPRLKDVIQLGFPWILNNQKMYAWQRYLKLFYVHLKELHELEPFFFFLLENLVSKIEKQKCLTEEYMISKEKLNEIGYSDKQINDFVENGNLIELSSCLLTKRQKDIIRAVINSTQEEVDYVDTTTQEYELEIRFKEKELEEILALM